MTVEQQFELLGKWIDRQIIPCSVMKHDVVFRDVMTDARYASRDAHHRSLLCMPPIGFPINHGWGALGKDDKQIHNMQIRHFGPSYAPIPFEQYKNINA